MSNHNINYLRERLSGPVIKIVDPKNHTTEEIISSYLLEIIFLARKFVRPTVELSDLVDEGIIGLLDAIKRFDAERAGDNPNGFHNLAIIRIKSFLSSFLLRNCNNFYTPQGVAWGLNYLGQIRNVISNYSGEEDINTIIRNYSCPEQEATMPKDIVAKLQQKKDKLRKMAESKGKSYEDLASKLLEVEKNMDQYPLSLEDSEEAPPTPEDLAAEKEFLRNFLNALMPDAKKVIQLSLDGKTLEEIGEELGKTRQRILQIKDDTMRYFQQTTMYKRATEG